MSTSAPVLLERRVQYYEYLLDAIRGNIHRRVREWFDAIYADKKRRPQALKHLQDVLGKVSVWNSMRVAAETAAVVGNDDVEYLPKLLTALVTVETKLLLIDEAMDAKDVSVRVPTLEAFVHQSFVEAARQLWKNIALFDPTLSKLEQQKNFVTCDGIISKAIRDAVRKLLPIKDIMRGVPPTASNSPPTANSAAAPPHAEPPPPPPPPPPQNGDDEGVDDDDDVDDDDEDDDEGEAREEPITPALAALALVPQDTSVNAGAIVAVETETNDDDDDDEDDALLTGELDTGFDQGSDEEYDDENEGAEGDDEFREPSTKSVVFVSSAQGAGVEVKKTFF